MKKGWKGNEVSPRKPLKKGEHCHSSTCEVKTLTQKPPVSPVFTISMPTIKTKQQKRVTPHRGVKHPQQFPPFLHCILPVTLESMHKYFDKANIYQLLCSLGLWLAAASKAKWYGLIRRGCLPGDVVGQEEIQSQSCLLSYITECISTDTTGKRTRLWVVWRRWRGVAPPSPGTRTYSRNVWRSVVLLRAQIYKYIIGNFL